MPVKACQTTKEEKNDEKTIDSWRSGSQYEKWTGWDKGPFLPGTRLRKDTKLPIAGQMPRFLINRDEPAGFGVPKKVQFDLKTWLDWLRAKSGGKKGKEKGKDGKKGGKKAAKGKKK